MINIPVGLRPTSALPNSDGLSAKATHSGTRLGGEQEPSKAFSALRNPHRHPTICQRSIRVNYAVYLNFGALGRI